MLPTPLRLRGENHDQGKRDELSSGEEVRISDEALRPAFLKHLAEVESLGDLRQREGADDERCDREHREQALQIAIGSGAARRTKACRPGRSGDWGPRDEARARIYRILAAMDEGTTDEATRIRETYARHSFRWQEPQYRGWMPGNLFTAQERERVMLSLLRRHGSFPLTEKRILDVGCGAGKTLLTFLRYGAQPENLFGIDLLEHEIEAARRLAPHLHFEVADAQRLPFDDDTMDLIFAFTLFSSIQGPSIRTTVAKEMLRVLRPTGAVLVYDFWTTGGINPDNRPMRLKEIRRLFPDCEVQARRVTLAPPLARRLAPRFWLACELLARIPLLRTHWLALATRKG